MKIKVRIPAVTLEVDTQKWSAEFCTERSHASIREDVRNYFDLSNNIPDHLSDMVSIV